MVARKDAAIVREAHKAYYGFDISDAWATDLAAFVDKPGKMPTILASGDPAIVREEVKSIYGFDVTGQYCADLIAFARQVTKGE